MLKVAILDDYQNVSHEFVDLKKLSGEYEFKILRESKEAERKRIEAEGISDFQRIVTKTITPQLLKWKGVEATQELSKSPNAKVIVIGNGDGDLPIILGGND